MISSIQAARARASSGGRISVALVLSYVFDWIIILAAAAVGAVFGILTPNKRPFALSDPDISFPYVHHEKVPASLAGIVSVVAPAAIIFLVSILLVPGPTVPKSVPKTLIWKRKLWEWHTGWLGLGLSCASAFLITNGMKNLFGKPRPDLLSRCQPDLDNAAQWIVGGYSGVTEGSNLFSAGICTNTDESILNDGFRSYPSGHSSMAAAGLIYLSLFLCSKLAITIPFIPFSTYGQASRFAAFPSRVDCAANMDKDFSPSEAGFQSSGHNDAVIAARNQAAAPPVYLLVFAIIPWFASIYIASTRWSDFRHHGFDILFGYIIGTVSSVFAFRFYHLPISQGAGWSYGPRSKERSFWAGVGVGSYAGEGSSRHTNRTESGRPNPDIEANVHRETSNDVSKVST